MKTWTTHWSSRELDKHTALSSCGIVTLQEKCSDIEDEVTCDICRYHLQNSSGST